MEYTEAYMRSIDEALADEEFMAKLSTAETKEQIQEIFLNEKGIEIDDTAAQAAIEKAEYIRGGGELTEEDLELVAGGCLGCWEYAARGAMAGIVIGGIAGFAVGGGYGAFAGAFVGAVVGGAIGLRYGRKKIHG